MNNKIKEILDRLERIDHKEYSCGFEFADSGSFDEDCRCFEERKVFANYITNLQQENERLKEQNNDLRKTYRNTYNKLFENGNDELARYFQAQIDDCPTFYVEPIIDYHKEWLDYKSRCKKAVEYIKSNPNVFYDENLIDVETLLNNEFTDEYAGEIRFISTLLNILQNGSDEE